MSMLLFSLSPVTFFLVFSLFVVQGAKPYTSVGFSIIDSRKGARNLG